MGNGRLRHEHQGKSQRNGTGSAFAQRKRNDGVGHKIQLDDTRADHPRHHQAQHLADRLIFQPNRALVSPIGQAQQAGQLKQQMPERSSHYPISQAADAPGLRQKERSQNHAQRVHSGRQRRDQEFLMGVKDAHRQAAQAKDDHRRQHDAQQAHCQVELYRVRIGHQQKEPAADQNRCKDPNQDADRYQNSQHDLDDPRSQPPGPSAVIAGKKAGKSGDKSRAKRPAGH